MPSVDLLASQFSRTRHPPTIIGAARARRHGVDSIAAHSQQRTGEACGYARATSFSAQMKSTHRWIDLRVR
jgi:hypothetical protein